MDYVKDVPLWIIAQHLPAGFRLPKRTLLQDLMTKCPKCKSDKKKGELTFWDAGIQEYVCRTCDLRRTSQSRRAAIVNISSRNNEPVRTGNIENSLYRYLIGVPVSSSVFTMCRCCGKSMYRGIHEFKEHNQQSCESDPAGDRMPCSKRLVMAQALLQKVGKCIVCQKTAYNEEWGYPICKQGPCLDAFRFTQTQWPMLKEALIKEAAQRAATKEILKESRRAHPEL